MGLFNHVVAALRQEDYSEQVLYDALQLKDDEQMEMFQLAQQRRLEHFPDNRAQARSVIEISNVCRQKCRYCAIGGKDQTKNYTLSAEQCKILSKEKLYLKTLPKHNQCYKTIQSKVIIMRFDLFFSWLTVEDFNYLLYLCTNT